MKHKRTSRHTRGRTMRWTLRIAFAAVVVAVLFVLAVHVLLPAQLQRFANRQLENIDEFYGSVGAVGIDWWRGGMTIADVVVHKESNPIGEPFVAAGKIDVSLAWRELVRGRLLVDVRIDDGGAVLVRGPTDEMSQLEFDDRWIQVANELMPIEVTRLEVRNGAFRFVDIESDPRVDIAVRDMHLVVSGLRNRPAAPDELPAVAELVGTTVGDGQLYARVEVDPMAELPRFDLALQVTDIFLPHLNDFLLAYANIDLAEGTLSIYMEAAAQDGAFEGYLKPFLADLDFDTGTDEERGLLSRIWESIVNLAESILRSPEDGQLGTLVPFSGDFTEDDIEVGVLATISNAVQHGFIEAFTEAFEGTISPDDIFGDDEPG